MNQHTPICVHCCCNYQCERNGILVRLSPDAIISTDMYQCPNCGNRILSGFAHTPAERSFGSYQGLFEAQDEAMGTATITDRNGVRP